MKMNRQNQKQHDEQSTSKVSRFMEQHNDEHNPISFDEKEKQRQIDVMWAWYYSQKTQRQQENA